ncbi:hypothetical protein [Aurantibacter aestuarii]|nr:hypothetical protein [Aurantibacter aestuarii]
MVRKVLFVLGFVIPVFLIAQVGVGTVTPRGALDIASTTSGLILPTLSLTATNVQTAINPQTGVIPDGTMVYNTNTTGGVNGVSPGVYYWSGAQWIRVPANGTNNDWSLNGNTGTTYGTNFLGTTDNTDVSLQRNGNRRVRLENSTTTFTDEIQTRDGSTDSGDVLVRIYDSADDGVIDIYQNNGVNHRFHGNGESVLNEQQLDLDFRIESDDFDDVFFVDGNDNLVSIGNRTPFFNTIDTFQSYAYFVDDHAVNGYSDSGVGVYGSDASNGFGVEGVASNTGVGVVGSASGGIPSFVLGSGGSFSGAGTGAFIESTIARGVGILAQVNGSGLVSFGGDEGAVISGNFIGAVGFNDTAGGYGLIGRTNATGTSAVFAIGNSGATGVKTFIIDHPLDPENKKLKHFSIESDEVLNVYRGTIELDANGEAQIELPAYFEAININFSYQLTPIGASMSDLYVSKEVSGNSFSVSGGKANKKVSWTVYAERNDMYLQTFPEQRETEVIKTDDERGKYLDYDAWKQPKEKGIFNPIKIETKTYEKTNKKGTIPTQFK